MNKRLSRLLHIPVSVKRRRVLALAIAVTICGIAVASWSIHSVQSRQAADRANTAQATKKSTTKQDTPATEQQHAGQTSQPQDQNTQTPAAQQTDSTTKTPGNPSGTSRILTPRPLPKPVPLPKPTTPVAITNLSLSTTGDVCSNGALHLLYRYTVDYNSPHAGGKLAMEWYYELTEPIYGYPSIPAPIINRPTILSNTSRYIDEALYQGLPYYSTYGYRVRLQATLPNLAYSNWVNVPAKSSSCY